MWWPWYYQVPIPYCGDFCRIGFLSFFSTLQFVVNFKFFWHCASDINELVLRNLKMKFVFILIINFLFFDSAMSTRDFTRHHKTGYSNYIADDTLKISVSYLALQETKFIDTYEISPPGVHLHKKFGEDFHTPVWSLCQKFLLVWYYSRLRLRFG